MLRELSIRNLAVIEQVSVKFHDGFHVLTGETGAGKSILIDALSLVVGGRGARIWFGTAVIKPKSKPCSSCRPRIPYGTS